jgi:ubiquinone/menaquinone biosynthesis C-methylase UbiE
MANNDAAFAGSIPALYDKHLGPLLFQPYAEDLARRLGDLKSGTLIETAAGTGIVTQALARRLPAAVDILATDLNQAMLDFAAAKPDMGRVKFKQADGQALPMADASFDALVCQFGIMFFPDRVAGYREAHRVLKPGGRALIAIWKGLPENPIARVVHETMARHLPKDPPRFLGRAPYGHGDEKTIRRELAAAGFTNVTIDTVTFPSRGTVDDPAIGFCQGSPLRAEIEARAPGGVKAATEAAAAALAKEFGQGRIEAPMQALIVTAVK